MWFNPCEIGQRPQQPPATFATPATFAKKIGDLGAKVAEVAEVAAPCYRWRVHFPDRDPLEVCFSPEASHAEVVALYPTALAAEAIEPGRQPQGEPLTEVQASELRTWLAPAISDGDDGLRTCRQCSNLRGGVCSVARPGGIVSAIRGYRPGQPDMLLRCAGFASREPAQSLAREVASAGP